MDFQDEALWSLFRQRNAWILAEERNLEDRTTQSEFSFDLPNYVSSSKWPKMLSQGANFCKIGFVWFRGQKWTISTRGVSNRSITTSRHLFTFGLKWVRPFEYVLDKLIAALFVYLKLNSRILHLKNYRYRWWFFRNSKPFQRRFNLKNLTFKDRYFQKTTQYGVLWTF